MSNELIEFKEEVYEYTIYLPGLTHKGMAIDWRMNGSDKVYHMQDYKDALVERYLKGDNEAKMRIERILLEWAYNERGIKIERVKR